MPKAKYEGPKSRSSASLDGAKKEVIKEIPKEVPKAQFVPYAEFQKPPVVAVSSKPPTGKPTLPANIINNYNN